MRETTRKTLAAWVVLVTAAGLAVGCSSSGSSKGGTGGNSGMSATGGGTGTGSGGSSGSTGGSSGGNSNCVIPTTWTDNLLYFGDMCLACAQANCCQQIVDCAGSPDCLHIYQCEQQCYADADADAGADGGTPDDAAMAATDNCVANCVTAGSMAGQTLYAAQNSCVNDDAPIATTCGRVGVCNN